MVGENGRVVAVDLQEEMLTTAREFARKKGVFERIRFHQCAADDLGLTNVKADFILAFYVVHEVPDRERFLRQVVELLKPNGHFLLIEPKHHVREFQFETILVEAKGLEQIKPIKIIASRGMLFKLNANNYNKLQK
jgi:ubiquinone/menaquinone biosynthesis C-methylase UbiE